MPSPFRRRKRRVATRRYTTAEWNRMAASQNMTFVVGERGQQQTLPFAFSDQPLVGWRAWNLLRCGGEYLLGSSSFNQRMVDCLRFSSPLDVRAACRQYLWLPRERAEASCRRNGAYLGNNRYVFPPHEPTETSPVPTCTCGLYVVKHDWLVLQLPVYGRVAIWGRVIEHEVGFRAQYAYPIELWVRGGVSFTDAAEALAATYGVPVQEGGAPLLAG